MRRKYWLAAAASVAASRRLGSLAVLSAVLTASSAAAQRAPAAPPKFTAKELTAPPTAGWITNGGNVYNQRYSPLARINKDNVATLKPSWRTHLNGSGTDSKYSGQAQPIVYDGVIYIPTGANDVFALDADTGEILWTYEAHLDPNITVICCGWLSRGVALGDGKVFSGQLDGKLVALDHATGKVVWSIQAETNQDGFSITSAPLYYDGLVITGFAGGDRASRGRVKAYDARDGKLVWTFYTIPGPGEAGPRHLAERQRHVEARRCGGLADAGRRSRARARLLLDGQPRPRSQRLGAARRQSLQRLDGRDRGEDGQVPLALPAGASRSVGLRLAESRRAVRRRLPDGKLRKGIVEIGKTGYVYILDRETGVPLVGIEERAVAQEPRQATAATQPFPLGDEVIPHEIDIEPEGYKLINKGRIFTPFWDEPVVVKPLGTGGANWPPSSYDPETNLFYVCVADGAAAYSTKEGGVEWVMPQPGGRYFGGEYTRSRVPRRGVFAAVDVTTNRLKWQQQWGEMCYAGTTVTGGGLIFVGRNDGRLTAHDKANGAQLWEFQTDAGIHAAVSTFERNGQQYVVALSAGSFFPGTTRGDSVWLFALDASAVPGGASAQPSGGAVELTH